MKIDVPAGLDPIDMVALQLAIAKARAGDKRRAESRGARLAGGGQVRCLRPSVRQSSLEALAAAAVCHPR
jgi:hypothetical protein